MKNRSYRNEAFILVQTTAKTTAVEGECAKLKKPSFPLSLQFVVEWFMEKN
jgi:hypothetical protein